MVKNEEYISGSRHDLCSCAKAVERSVNKIDGVLSANVNLAADKLFVEFDESKTDSEEIKEAVKRQVIQYWKS